MKLKPLTSAMMLAGTIALSACSPSDQVQQTAAEVQALSASQQLNVLLDEYFQQSMQRNPVYATFVGMHQYNDRFSPPISAGSVADDLAFEQKYLQKIQAIDASQLQGQEWLSHSIFERDRQLAIDSYQFKGYQIPLSQMGGAHSWFAMLGSGSSAQPFNTLADFDNFIARAQGFADYMDSTITAMREGVESGRVLPKPIVAKVLPQLQTHMVEDVTDSVFYGPVKMLAEINGASEEQKAAMQEKYSQMITQVIIPAYTRVHDYLASEYVAEARDTVGMSGLPNGKAWYEHQIATNTTLPLTAEEIHQFGQQEVQRILDAMIEVKEQVGFQGDLAAFFEHLRTDDKFYFESEQAVIDGYTQIKHKIEERLPQLFEVFPKADYEVRAVEAYRAASAAGASYQGPAPDGSRPGIFYINTHNLKAQPKFLMETLSIHEAAPGHHFQVTIQQEIEGLPMFRKFGGYTVFAEGWALYAESLGKEMGLFTDPFMWYGRLVDEQLRAMRLVVDTGIHAFGWSREKAIDFMLSNSSMAESDVIAEVERYISWPGQAVSYKVGERHIRMLRDKAAAALGEDFDVRKFHTQILIDGALPMPVLEAKIDKWIASQV